MGLISEIQFDRDQCRHCGQLLYQHFGGKHTREVLREHDSELVIATIVDVRCAECSSVTSVFYMVDPLPPSGSSRFAVVPTGGAGKGSNNDFNSQHASRIIGACNY